MSIELKNICKSFNGTEVLKDLSFSIPPTGIFGIFGPSGCGKTTVLRLICGLESPDSGQITGNEDLSASVVFQEDRLLKASTVLENVSLVSDKATAINVLEKVGLAKNIDSYPSELSGGMKRRVAIARALAFGGDFLVLDEPLKGIDSELKADIISMFSEYSKTKPVLLVTHDEHEKQIVSSSIYLTHKN